MEKKIYEIEIAENEVVYIHTIGEIDKEGKLEFTYKYGGDLPDYKVASLLTKKINEIIEKAIYGENDA